MLLQIGSTLKKTESAWKLVMVTARGLDTDSSFPKLATTFGFSSIFYNIYAIYHGNESVLSIMIFRDI